ncbi:hypothetical protein BpHYR1_029479 [Brachionus plicatilis]|uniref:Uncharacterized protein n=1 Tax=Brachionus plicatilis TaxID=10195 RepID=A0A3M7S288_BRAPC|nr:hypothetical protein BpHYR1_029479 [Brachionus plicatilis]
MIRVTNFCLKTVCRINIQKSVSRNLRISGCVQSLPENFKKFEQNNAYQKRNEFSKILIGAFSVLVFN